MSAGRADRRRVVRLQGDVDRVLEGDARFFARFPARQHRIRMAARVEITLNAAVHGRHAIPDEPGAQWFVAVKQVQPGTFARAFVQADPGASTDLSEEHARRVYEHLTRNTDAPRIEAVYGTGARRGDA